MHTLASDISRTKGTSGMVRRTFLKWWTLLSNQTNSESQQRTFRTGGKPVNIFSIFSFAKVESILTAVMYEMTVDIIIRSRCFPLIFPVSIFINKDSFEKWKAENACFQVYFTRNNKTKNKITNRQDLLSRRTQGREFFVQVRGSPSHVSDLASH